MNDALDELLRAHGQTWAQAQPAPPPLDEAVRKATDRRDLRPRLAVAAIVLVVAAVAAIPVFRSTTGGGTTHRSGGSAIPSVSAAPTTVLSSEPVLPADPVLRTLTERARSVAAGNDDPHATGEAVRTTFADAERVLDTGESSDPPGSTEVWVIQLHGTFTCHTCSRPSPGIPIKGTAIELIINARTFDGYVFGIVHEPHDITKLGTPVALPM